MDDDSIIYAQTDDNHIDDHVDDEIKQCFNAGNPKSFFMFAGAGSGKTRSLVNVLTYLDNEIGFKLKTHFKQIAVITYTNAACEEIMKRINYKSIFNVATIHSFLWELIKSFQLNIKEWITEKLEQEIADLLEKQSKGKGGDAAKKREEEINKNKSRLAKLKTIYKFNYNPSGDNVGYDSLNHSDVIKMGSEFLLEHETMQQILVNKFPILLIDESQDTKKELVDSLFAIHEKYSDKFIIGMFGDTMQKIYLDGKENLESCIPPNWAKPIKVMNHRSAKRIVQLANSIRTGIDLKRQRFRSDAEQGFVRLFLASSSANKEIIESKVAAEMANITQDIEWSNGDKYKSLILEHHMAASRFGFLDFYSSLQESKQFDTALREGTILEISLLANVISPLVKAAKSGDGFEVARILLKNSPLLNKKSFRQNEQSQITVLESANKAIDQLKNLFKDDKAPTCFEVLKISVANRLIATNERMDRILSNSVIDDKKDIALQKAFESPFVQLENYAAYVNGRSRFDTHQGVKGLEFPRVMVIIDDKEAKGFLFSYEKLFGAKEKSDTDIKNEKEGKETSVDRTKRLFYVACTRAIKSLAVIAYTENIKEIEQTILNNKWFAKEEVMFLE